MSQRKAKAALAAVAAGVTAFFLWRRYVTSRVPRDSNNIDFAAQKVEAVPADTGRAAAVSVQEPPAEVDNRRLYVCEGASIIVSDGWYRTENDTAPPSPNIVLAVLTKLPPGTSQSLTHDSPLVIFTVEDFHNVPLSLEEYTKKCFVVAMEQAHAMSQGRFQPTVETHCPCSHGIFGHYIKYTNKLGESDFHVAMYLAVVGTVGVTIQLLSPSSSTAVANKPAFDAMAATVEVSIPPRPTPFLDYYYVEEVHGVFEVPLDLSWSAHTAGGAVEVRPVGRKDTLTIYAKGTLPPQIAQLPTLEQRVLRSVNVSVRNSKTTLFSTNTIEVVRIQESGAFSDDDTAAFTAAIRTVSTTAIKKSRRFYAVREKMSFQIEPNGYVLISQLVRGTMVYFPLHNPLSGLPPPPGASISCTLQFDADAPKDVDGWMQQLEQSGGAEINSIIRQKVGGRDAIMSSEQHPEHPIQITTVVLPTPHVSYFMQWESAVSDWPGFSSRFKAFNDNLRIE